GKFWSRPSYKAIDEAARRSASLLLSRGMMIMANDQKKPPKLPVGPHKEAQILPPGSELPELRKDMLQAPKSYLDIKDPKVKWQVLVETLRRTRRSLLNIPHATAVDIGYKIVGGYFKNELAIRLHLKRKLPDNVKDTLFKDRPYDFIPKTGEAKNSYFQLKA